MLASHKNYHWSVYLLGGVAQNGEGLVWSKGTLLPLMFQLSHASRSQISADAGKVSIHLTTEVPRFFCFFSNFFFLSYIFANSGKCNREGLYEPECVKSLVMYPFEYYHWNSNPYDLIHRLSPQHSRAKRCLCLCWAMSQENPLTPAEVFCVCLTMVNTSISPEKITYDLL